MRHCCCAILSCALVFAAPALPIWNADCRARCAMRRGGGLAPLSWPAQSVARSRAQAPRRRAAKATRALDGRTRAGRRHSGIENRLPFNTVRGDAASQKRLSRRRPPSHNAPSELQAGPRRRPERPKTASRLPQNDRKKLCRRRRRPEDGPKEPQDGPRGLRPQGAPMTAPQEPRTLLRPPNTS